MILEFLRAIHVFACFRADHLLGFGVLLPFQGEHEQLQCGVVELISLLVFALIVVLDGLFDCVDCSSEEIGIAHGEGEFRDFLFACSFVIREEGGGGREDERQGKRARFAAGWRSMEGGMRRKVELEAKQGDV